MPEANTDAAPGDSGSHFFVAFKVLSPDRRAAIQAVYGFCRAADDAVDDAENAEQARRSLESVRQELRGVFGSDPLDGPSGRLRAAIERYGLPRAPFDDLLEGVSWDLEGRRYDDHAAVREYCYRVASTVGLLCVRIFGFSDGSADAYARELGVALQWTNILRDIGADLSLGRVYLPQDSLSRHGLTEADLTQPDEAARGRLRELVRHEVAYAESCYEQAERLKPRGVGSRLLAAEIMGGVYRQLLLRVERLGDGVIDQRARVGGLQRVWIAARLFAGRRIAGWMHGGR